MVDINYAGEEIYYKNIPVIWKHICGMN